MKKTRRAVANYLVSFTSAALIATACQRDAPAPSGAAASPSASETAASTARSNLTIESLVALLSEPDDFARVRKLAELLPTLGPEAVPVVQQVLELMAAARIELTSADYELLMRFWAVHDPEEASRYAFGKSPRGYRVGAIYATVRPWMKADPEKAVGFLREWATEEGDYGAAVQVAIVRGWYASGKPGLEQYIHDLGPSFERQRALGAYLTDVIRARGSAAAVGWAESIPEQDSAYRLEAFRATGESLVPFDVDAAKRFCDAHCEGADGAAVRALIATRWVLRGKGEGADALEWLSTAAANEETEFAVRRTFAMWADFERDAALSWMKPYVDGETPKWLKPALPIYVRELGEKSPEEALVLVERFFSDERVHDHWTFEIVRHWRQRDEKAAEAWIAHASLSKDLLDRIRAPKTRADELRIERERKQQSVLGRASG